VLNKYHYFLPNSRRLFSTQFGVIVANFIIPSVHVITNKLAKDEPLLRARWL